MNILLVSAYAEPKSFGGLLKNKLAKDLQDLGHHILISDLYAQKFPAIAFPGDFPSRKNPDYFELQAEQHHALINHTLPNAVQAEQEKILTADTVIFLCPIYWSSPPAILKGWLEQVLSPGFAYDKNHIFENGLLKGKTAFFAVTYSGKLGAATIAGASAAARELLRPLENQALGYSGFDILPALGINPPAFSDEQARKDILNQTVATLSERIQNIQNKPVTANDVAFPIIHINGRPGVGKKTVAKALAKMTGGTLVDNHTLINPGVAACDRGTDGYYRINHAVRRAVFDELLQACKQRPIILTNTLTDQVDEHREIYAEIELLARKARAPLTQIVLTATFDENARRLQSPARKADFKLTDRNELSRLYNFYTIIAPPAAITIDTSGLTAHASARLIRDHVFSDKKNLSHPPEAKP